MFGMKYIVKPDRYGYEQRNTIFGMDMDLDMKQRSVKHEAENGGYGIDLRIIR